MGKLNLEEEGRNYRIIVPKEETYAHYGTEALLSVPAEMDVHRCHSDMGIPAFRASPFPYP